MSETSAPPTCYRHGDRETYVRCTRCERPICPDCMVSASVGFQCPECVAEGSAGAREATTVAGGALTSNPGIVTRVLIGLNVAIFLIEQLVGGNGFATDYGLWPLAVADGEYHRMLTSGFLHGSITHLLFNMLALYWLGTPLEAMLGRWRYVLLYAAALLGGSVASFCFSPVNTLSVGASGAIFGLMGAFVVVAVKQKLDLRPFAVLIILNLAIGFIVPNIDWIAHLGGLAVGAILGAAMIFPSRERRRPVLLATLGILLVVLGAATAWRIADLRDQFSQLFGL
jgi:membrane associated rhomboid family serine protease